LSLPDKPLLYFDDAALRTTLTKLQSVLLQTSAADSVYVETLALTAAIELSRLQFPISAEDMDKGKLSKRHERLVLDYISDHLDRNITLSELAASTGLSRFHFARSFKASTGLPPHQFVLICRIEQAKRALIDGDQPLSEIARSSGFGSYSQFAIAFRRLTGTTPSQFRRQR
jgi:AraC family transcriptional regulator